MILRNSQKRDRGGRKKRSAHRTLAVALALAGVVVVLGAGTAAAAVSNVGVNGGISGFNADDGPYTVTVTDNRTNASATTDEITVTEAASGSVSLNQTIYSEERGNVVRIGISLSNTDNATVTIGDVSDNNWAQNATVRDGDGDDFVTLVFNTYTAGTSDDTLPSGSGSYTVYAVADSDDSILNVAPASGSFDPSTPEERTLGAADYAIKAVAGNTPARQTADGEDAAATLSLGERSTDAVTNFVAPDAKGSEISSVADISDFLDDGNITETSTVATKDILLAKVDASGLSGVIRNRTDSGLSETEAFFSEAGNFGGDPATAAWGFAVEQTNPNGDDATLNTSNTDLFVDQGNDTLWLVVDTAEVKEFSAGDELETNFTTLDGNDVNPDDTTVTDAWTFSEPSATVDTNADIDNDGKEDEIVVFDTSGQTIPGQTNVAPGTELDVPVTGTDESSPFLKPLSARVQTDGSFTAIGNFSDNTVGANFTVGVRRGSTSLLANEVDGTIKGAPTVVTNNGSTVDEGANETITQSELETTDPEQGPSSLTYTVDTDVSEGQLVNTNTNTQLDQGDTFTQKDVNDGFIKYRHDGTEPTSESFDFTVSDGSGGSTSDTFSITINQINDAPTITGDLSLSTTEGSSVTIGSGDLDADDPDDSPSDLTYTVTSAPANGNIEVNGAVASTFTEAELDNGKVAYAHDGSQTTSDAFDVELADGGEDGAGTDTATVNVSVTTRNDAPTVVNNTGSTVDEGANDTITRSELETTDEESGPSGITYTVDADVSEGQIVNTDTSKQVDRNDTFTQADINSGIIEYQHDGTEPTSEGFDFTVRDGAGGSATGAFSFTINQVNDAPNVSVDSLPNTVDEDENNTLGASFTDPDSGDTHTATVDWGDGTNESASVDQTNDTVSASHTYDNEGSYTVTVTVEDDDGGTGSANDTVSVQGVSEADQEASRDDCIDRRSTSRGQEDRACPSEDGIRRDRSRGETDRNTGRDGDTRRRDRGRGEGRNRGR